MNGQAALTPDERIGSAVDELEGTIRASYPSSKFGLSRNLDDPRAVHLIVTVDLDDPFEVLDLVIDRVVDLQVDEGIPLHVIPMRTPERMAAELARRTPNAPAAAP